jgi:hypothetical protein
MALRRAVLPAAFVFTLGAGLVLSACNEDSRPEDAPEQIEPTLPPAPEGREGEIDLERLNPGQPPPNPAEPPTAPDATTTPPRDPDLEPPPGQDELPPGTGPVGQ